jgi:branched-chain amino acid transport system ATP-binding protein
MMLSVDHLNVDIQSSQILRNISISVEAGEFVCLVGRNGAGKTTTMRSILGYIRPTSGTVHVDGRSVIGLPTHRIARMGVAYSPEESEVFTSLTVAQNIEMSTWVQQSAKSATDRIETAYAVFPKLRDYCARGGGQLSGGERKMLSIARALSQDPQLLLLDEPFEGLSPAILPEISGSIQQITRLGLSVLQAESNLHHVPSFADRLYVIERGEIIFAGSPAEAKHDRLVMRVISAERS